MIALSAEMDCLEAVSMEVVEESGFLAEAMSTTAL